MQWWYYQQYPQPNMMFLYSCIPQPKEFQVLNLPQSMENLDEQQKQKTKDQNKNIKEKLIILEKQDLEQAGYELDKKLWTQDQDKILKELMKKKKMDWVQIAKSLPGRNPKMCYNRYRRIQSSTKKCWTNKQNNTIIEMVNNMGQDWDKISKALKDRSTKQIKDHYYQYLEPSLNKSPWTLEQDLMLIDLINQHGYDWKGLGKIFPNRTQFQVKNRYFGKIKKLNERKISNGQLSEKHSQIKQQQI